MDTEKNWDREVIWPGLGLGFCVEKKLPWGGKGTGIRAERETSKEAGPSSGLGS